MITPSPAVSPIPMGDYVVGGLPSWRSGHGMALLFLLGLFTTFRMGPGCGLLARPAYLVWGDGGCLVSFSHVSNCSVKLAGVAIFFAVPAVMAPCPVLNEVKEFTRDRILWTTQLVHKYAY